MIDEMEQMATWREEGWRFSTTTPEGVQEHDAELDIPGIEFRALVITPGYRTWLFRTQADAMEFRRTYGVPL